MPRRRQVRLLVLLIAAIAAPLGLFWATSVAVSAGSTVVETETMTIDSDSDTHVYNDTAASGGKALSWPGNDVVNGSVTTSATTTTLTLRMRGDLCNGGPNAIVKVDGATQLTTIASTATFADYSATVNIPAGTHSVSITYSNDTKTSSCDRNLRTDTLTFVTPGGGGGDLTPPANPTGLTATPGDKTAALAWNANTESDLAGYNVYRSTTTGGPYTKDNTALVTTPSYNDTGLTNGTKYFWVVQAVDTSTNPSGNSNETSGTPAAAQDTTKPGAPQGLNATGGDTTASLTWTANNEPDLAGYNVYRSTTSGGPYTKDNTSLVPSPSYTDTGLTNGTTYFYVVTAVDQSNNESVNSAQTQATPAASGGGGGGGTSTIEAETFTIPSSSGAHIFNDTSASAGQAVSFWSNDTISKTATTVAGTTVIVRARGDQCNGAPNVVLGIDGQTVLSTAVSAGTWTNYSVARAVSAGSHTFSLTYNNDTKTSSCDRNLRVDTITINSGSGTTPTLQLPDLVQQPPTQMSITQASASYRLGMNSAVENHGGGPLIVNGHRANTTASMVADQIVNRSDGSTQTFAGIGSMIFYTPHNHWHYLGFDKYELRNPSDNSLVAPDQKMGFCLGDRYTPNSNGTRNENPAAGPFTFNNCAPGNTAALSLTEGISPGYGDEYVPQLEGQYIDVTGVQPGQYYVVHRTNSDSALKESDYTNDVASALVQLWPNGYGVLPGLTVLKTCPGTATCSLAAKAPTPSSFRFPRGGIAVGGLPFQLRHSPPPDDPPLMVKTAARFYAHQALQRIVGQNSSRAKVRCARSSRRGFSCATSWRVAGSTYRGTLDIALPPRNTEYWWTYRARLVRKNAHGVRTIARRTTRVLVPHRTK